MLRNQPGSAASEGAHEPGSASCISSVTLLLTRSKTGRAIKSLSLLALDEDAFPERVVEEPGPAVVAVLALETIGVCLKKRVKGTGKFSPNAACHPRILKNRRFLSIFAP
jgi:hypothetical protein